MKEKDSWSKPDGIINLAGRKKVDMSFIKNGETGVPILFYDEFSTIKKLEMDKPPGKRIIVNVVFIYKGEKYEGCFLRRSTGQVCIYIEDTKLKEEIRNIFSESMAYIEERRAEIEGGKKFVTLPDHMAEYVEFYRTEEEDVYEIKFSKDDEILSGKEIMQQVYSKEIQIDKIQQYFKQKGLYYTDEVLSNFYLSLKSKPFTILAGISGTGKSKLARLFSEAIGADFTLISVKPDWSDATDLIGYMDLNQNYHMGKFIEVINRAKDNLDKPYIICLDEMNLARVEYYFSDFLSLIESRRWDGDKIITDPFNGEVSNQYIIPENVYIVGTVNMDETTFQFSKKVLDRANTIELSEVNLAYDFEEGAAGDEEVEEVTSLHNEVLRSKYLVLRECAEHKELATEIIEKLIAINEFLIPCGLQFAYRVRDEVVFYMLYNAEYGLMETEEAFDFQILQKVLPRINGTSERVRKLIVNLVGYCTGNAKKVAEAFTVEELEPLVEDAIYPRSARKLVDMLRRYDEDGFTSFWF